MSNANEPATDPFPVLRTAFCTLVSDGGDHYIHLKFPDSPTAFDAYRELLTFINATAKLSEPTT